MRVSPISSAFAHKSAPQNISFGKIDPENREKIIELLPFPEDAFMKSYYLYHIDGNMGVTIKLGSEDNPKGTVYAELNPEHVEKSWLKEEYLAMSMDEEDAPEEIKKEVWLANYNCLNNLEDEENFERFYDCIESCTENENPDGTKIIKEKTVSDDGDVRDAAMIAADLYGTRY